jgi:transposase-like protein
VNAHPKYGLDIHLERFSTDKQCQDYLFAIKWNGVPKCPSCGNTYKNYYITSRKVYKCSECYRQFSLTQGTIFERSKIPLVKWFLTIYLFTTKKKGLSSVQLSKWLGVEQRTAWFMLQRLREALKEENNAILDGIIEVDETFIGPDINRDTRLQKIRKLHYQEQDRIHGMHRNKARRIRGFSTKIGRKKGSTKEVLAKKKLEQEEKGDRLPFERCTAVLGMLERNGRIVMKKIGHSKSSLRKDIIYPLLEKHISYESTLITDQLNLYDDTEHLFYEHQTVNHDIAYVIDGIHTNGIENAWKHLKLMISGTYFHLSKHHFNRYLNENTYRWNRKNNTERALFEDFMSLTMKERISYKELIKKEQIKMAA